MFMPGRGCFAVNAAILESNNENIHNYPICCPCFCACSIVSVLTFGLCGIACQPVDIFSQNCCVGRKSYKDYS
jgi:hypothetical protein